MKKILLFILPVLLFIGCGKENEKKAATQKRDYALFTHGNKPTTPPPVETQKPQKTKCKKRETVAKELDFEVENATGKTIFVTCFSYVQKEPIQRWKWDKSSVYKLEQGQKIVVNIDTIPDESDRQYVFGYLAVFNDEQRAHDSIYELLDDTEKIDLDQLYKLRDKTIVLQVEKYGFKEEKLDFAVADKFKKKATEEELDFIIENETGRTVFVTAFIYQVKDNIRTVWNYNKTAVQRLEPGQQSLIDVETIIEPRDRDYVLGYLAVFEAHEEELAHKATYELLQPKNRMYIGKLSQIKDKKIVLRVEQYGSIGKVADFGIQPAQSPIVRMIEKATPKKEVLTKKEAKRKQKETKPTAKVEKVAPKRNRGTYQFFAKR